MTKAELATKTVWDENGLGNLSLFIPLFNESINIVLFPDLTPEVTEDAFSKSTIKEIHVLDEFTNRYAEIKVNTGSDNYISLIVKNGRIIDFGDDGVHLGWFEEDERYLHKKRQQILAE